MEIKEELNFKETLLKRIKNMSIDGENAFKVKCDKYIIEFQLIKINNITFLAYSGASCSLTTFFINSLTDYDEIMHEFEWGCLKRIDLKIEDCTFFS